MGIQASESLQTVTKWLGWDVNFAPSKGQFETDHEYHVELAGGEASGPEYIRFGSDASPGSRGRVEYFDWHRIDQPGKPVRELRPCVVLRLDLSRIARMLQGAFGGS